MVATASEAISPYVASGRVSADGVAPERGGPWHRSIDNPWFPLVAGTTFTYRGTKDGKHAIDKFSVLDKRP